MGKSGFTLIEIMIVIAIIGILVAIAGPQYAKYRKQAQDNVAKLALHQLAKAEEDYYIQFRTYTDDKNRLRAANGWFAERPVIVTILAGSSHSWSATSSHESSEHVWSYSSSRGGLQ